MTPPAQGLLDTSVFIAREAGRSCGPLPSLGAVSVVTLGELELGVLNAEEPSVRAQRASTLALARGADPIPLTESVLSAWARLISDCRRAGITRTVRLTDALIAATAIDRGLPVVTQDTNFDPMAEAHPALSVYRV